MKYEFSIKRGLALFLLLALCLFPAACATTTAERDAGERALEARAEAVCEYPPYSGEKTPLAVLPMGLSKRAAERYPHLLERSVGMGLHNVLADELYQTGRFRFVEEKESVVKDVFKRQWLSASGAVDQGSAVELGRVLGAKKVVYGEVYDYAEGADTTVSGFSAKKTPRVRVGVQIRLVDVTTLEYVPASGVAHGRDWGEASQKAIRIAVCKLVR